MRFAALAIALAACTSRAPALHTVADDGRPDGDGGSADAGTPPPQTTAPPDAGADGGTVAACPPIAPAQGLCEAEWCWDYPVPFGYHLSAIAPGAGDDLWVGGESMIARRSRGVWAMWPAAGAVTRLWISPSGSAFALVQGAGVQRFDQGRWSTELAGARDVSFAGATSAYALHDTTIVRWDGAKWTDAYVPSVWVQSIAAVSATDVWAASPEVFVHYNGATWTETPHGFTSVVSTGVGQWTTAAVDLSTLLYSPGGDLWAAGGCGGVAVHDPAGWRLVATPGCGWRSQGHMQVTGVAGPREDPWFTIRDVWYEGTRPIYTDNFARWTPTGFSRIAVDRSIGAIASTASGSYAVGPFGTVWKQDGASWSRIMGGDGSVSALAVDGCGSALAAAYLGSSMFPTSGSFLRNEGTGWLDDGVDPGAIHTIVAAAFDDAWAVPFFGGGLVHRTANGWSGVTGDAADAGIVAASGPNDVWAVGRDVWHFDGTGWTRTPIGLDWVDFIWTRAANDSWAVRRGQRLDSPGLWHWDGTVWSPQAGPPAFPTSLAGGSDGPWIATIDSIDVAARKAPPTLYHLVDGAWIVVPVAETSLTAEAAVQVTADGDVFVSAYGLPLDQMLRWTGTSFVRVKSGVVASDRAGHLWLSNGRGILRPR